ncbi:hypothetical protein K466DRAFT_599596 [Polyporus arcularius HHB13444]|uniref:Uncharacterized protein n=1 Tax=Polyporus arcularius HHB13444 TaxID=1314778 RepID=A0A5C3PCH9_9APHY|nr:hypothetical protein K466DRAFT_599596 [Polyporus arcularius HHB13444]
MAFLRSYDRPGEPRAIFRIPNFIRPSVKYSPELKAIACEGFHERVPVWPDECPRCHAHIPVFTIQCGFKAGIAGAAIFICNVCRKPHIPVQTGPSEEQLSRIEAQRRFDNEQERLRKAANAVVVHSKKDRKRGGIPGYLSKAAQLLFRNPMSDGKGGIVEGDRPGGVVKTDKSELTTPLDIYFFRQSGEPPLMITDFMRKDGRVQLIDYHWFAPICEGIRLSVFERWDLDQHRWILVPFSSSIMIALDNNNVHMLFLRVYGVSCELGPWLSLRDEAQGHALPPELSVSWRILEEVRGNFWLVAWTKDDEPPHIQSLARREYKHGTSVQIKDLFDGAGVLYYAEEDSSWQPFPPPAGSWLRIPPRANAVLLRRVGLTRLRGFGDAMYALERLARGRAAGGGSSARSPLERIQDELEHSLESLVALGHHITQDKMSAAPVLPWDTPARISDLKARAAPEACPAASSPAPSSERARARCAPGGYRVVFENGKEVIDVSED